MLSSTSSFVASTIPLYHSAIKGLIFRCADLLVVVAVYKFFSLIAATANLFTEYLMFGEGYIQRALFVSSRRLVSPSSILVLSFTVAYLMADLYGVMLWALDAPGYVFQTTNAIITAFDSPFVDDPAYIVYVAATAGNLESLQENLPRIIGGNLFKPSLNLTLTGNVSYGQPQVTKPTQTGTGGRIWLDDSGLSVSPDTAVMVSYRTDATGQYIGLECPVQATAGATGGGWGWNCTFDNAFAQELIRTPVGLPEIHWDDASDAELDSRYLRPNRRDNIWAALNQGGGTSLMKQVFTVTKARRRHVFLETAVRATMLTSPPHPFARAEVDDLLRRTWSTNASEQHHPLLARLAGSIDRAQAQNRSFIFGLNGATGDGTTTTQVTWEYLTWENDRSPFLSFLRVTSTNITLVRSETLVEEAVPVPWGDSACAARFMNLAYGGRVTDTDCTAGGTPPAGVGLPGTNASSPTAANAFFGQADTAAVLILSGLGDGGSNLSRPALDEVVWEWTTGPGQLRMDALLLARAFAVSVDPALVAVASATVVAAASWLQLMLVLAAAGAALATWAALTWLLPLLLRRGGRGGHEVSAQWWSSSLFAILVHATLRDGAETPGTADGSGGGAGPAKKKDTAWTRWWSHLVEGYSRNPPEVTLRLSPNREQARLLLDGKEVALMDDRIEVAHAPDPEVSHKGSQKLPGVDIERGE